jgi:uncharacterized phage infection (PIP) family protein YhgE
MDDKDYDEIVRKMLEDGYTTPPYIASGLTLQPGLLGETPSSIQPNENSSAENALNSLQEKNQQATQQMADIGQQGIQTAMQASQVLQAQRQAEMNATAQQAAQLAQQQAQQGSLFGGLLGGLINKFLIPVKFGGGRK